MHPLNYLSVGDGPLTVPDNLPSKSSDLLEKSLLDLNLVSKDPRYFINMNVWHDPYPSAPCQVCLAGSVMAKSLNTPSDMEANPFLFSQSIHRKLAALNEFRIGNVSVALEILGVDLSDEGLLSSVKALDLRYFEKLHPNAELSVLTEHLNQMVSDLRALGL